MRGKIAFILGGAIGYVLGSRAGRERYEQIKRGANHLWHTAPVQNGVSVVKDAVDERTDDLKAFAIRVGGDVFSNLAQARTKSDPFSTTDDAASESGSKSAGSGTKSGSSKSSSAKSASAKSSSSKSTSSKSASSKGKSASGSSKTGGSKAGS